MRGEDDWAGEGFGTKSTAGENLKTLGSISVKLATGHARTHMGVVEEDERTLKPLRPDGAFMSSICQAVRQVVFFPLPRSRSGWTLNPKRTVGSHPPRFFETEP